MTTAEGIVLRERPVGEQDKFIDILTKEQGVIELSVRGARKINGKSGSSAQLFAYSRFCMDQRGDRLYLNSAEPIHIFYGLRNSLTRLSLASYFAEVVGFCIRPGTDSGDILRLLLNTLYYLENESRSEKFLKSVFEFRLMSETGFMPDILACQGCGAFEPEEVFFFIDSGGFCCADCFDRNCGKKYMQVKLPVLRAVRHIVLSDLNKLFNFRVSETVQLSLTALSEEYILSHLERSFRTLEFYKDLFR